MYQKMYIRLFRAVTDALQELEENNLGRARRLLQGAQIDCEEIYIQSQEQGMIITIPREDENK